MVSEGVRSRVQEMVVYPDCVPPDMESELRHFAIRVVWRGQPGKTGRGGYAIVDSAGRHLSKKGKWRYNPEPFIQRHYRYQSLPLALALAGEAVHDVKLFGRTAEELILKMQEEKQ